MLDPWVWGWKYVTDSDNCLHHGFESPDFNRKAPTPNPGLKWILYRASSPDMGVSMEGDKVNGTMKTRLQFSVRTLMAVVTLMAAFLGGWSAYTNLKIRNLEGLRQHGAIVILRDGTPEWLRSFGIDRLGPYFTVPTVELYVTPKGNDAIVGNSDVLTSKTVARKLILDQATTARANGASDIQLGIVDTIDIDWVKFASGHSLSSVFESNPRYAARLKANLESGANINP